MGKLLRVAFGIPVDHLQLEHTGVVADRFGSPDYSACGICGIPRVGFVLGGIFTFGHCIGFFSVLLLDAVWVSEG